MTFDECLRRITLRVELTAALVAVMADTPECRDQHTLDVLKINTDLAVQDVVHLRALLAERTEQYA